MNEPLQISRWWRKVWIQPDDWAGYEVMQRFIWWPWPFYFGGCNTHVSIERAKQWAIRKVHNRTYI